MLCAVSIFPTFAAAGLGEPAIAVPSYVQCLARIVMPWDQVFEKLLQLQFALEVRDYASSHAS